MRGCDLGLCLNGGICDAASQTCLCPPGFRGDFFVFHSDNCALPDAAPFWLLLQLVILAVPALLLLVWAVFLNSKVKVAGNALRMLAGTLLGVLGSLLMFIGEYVQGGAYEMFCIFMFPTLMGPLISLWFLVHICLDALKSTMYLHEVKRLQRLLSIGALLVAISFLCFSIALLIVVRGNDDVFNLANSVVLMLEGSAALGFCGVAYYVMTSLHTLLKKHGANQSDYFIQFAGRVRLSRNLSVFFLSSFGVTSLAMGAIQLGLGSMPFAWVIISVSIDSTLGIVLAAVAFVERDALTATNAMTNVVQLVQTSLRSLDSGNDGNSGSDRILSSSAMTPRAKMSAFSTSRS